MNNDVITYTQSIVFNYKLPDDDTIYGIERELTIIWEDNLDALLEEKGKDVEHEIHSFSTPMQQKQFVDKIEQSIEDTIEEVEEEISNKTKFGFEFTGQLHNDD
jgi:predicted DNA-binding transcriptional regulator